MIMSIGDGKIKIEFSIKDMNEEDIKYVTEELENSYRRMVKLIEARRRLE